MAKLIYSMLTSLDTASGLDNGTANDEAGLQKRARGLNRMLAGTVWPPVSRWPSS